MGTFWKVKFGTYKTKIPFFDSSQFSLSSLYYVWSCSLLFLLLLVSLHLSQSFSCFNPRNKNTTAATRFVTLHNQFRLTPSLCYLGFSLSSQPWPNPWAPPPPPLVTVGLPFLSICLYFYFSFLCFWLYLGCLGDWVQFGMWKSFDNLAWVWNYGHLSGCVCRSGKKTRVQKNQVENVAKGKEEGSGGYGFRKAVAADWGWFSTTISS